MKQKIGLIGLGLMGNPMGKNILKAGFPLFVYSRNPEKSQLLHNLGAKVTTSPKDLASQVDILITMVTGPKDVKQVLFGKDGAVKGAKEGLIIIDMSTIGKTAAEEIGAKLAQNNIDFIDAPVTGGTIGAINGELVIYIGGKNSVLVKVKPVLMAMGTTLHHIGPIGSGQGVKLINNHLIGAGIVALSEGMLLADEMGLSRAKVADAIQEAPIVSKQMLRVLPNYVSGDYPVKFIVRNLLKDLSLAFAEISKKRKSFNILNVTKNLYTRAVKENHGEEDYSSIIKILK